MDGINHKALVRLRRPMDSVADGAAPLHPWIFSGSVASVSGDPAPGDTLRVADSRGRFLAWAHYNPDSGIVCRVLSRDAAAPPDAEWMAERVAAAVALRRRLPGLASAEGVRLLFSESDGLPGLVADQYGRHVVLQSSTPGMDRVKARLAAVLLDRAGAEGVSELSDPEARKAEGLPPAEGLLAGSAPPAGGVPFREDSFTFRARMDSGQKTGFYLDQRDNRRRAAAYVREGAAVLDAFCHSGAFAVRAAAAGAERLTLVDSSGPALEAAKGHFAANGLPAFDVQFEKGDAFAILRGLRDRRAAFDMAFVDPPKLAASRGQAEKALRAYKDANLLAMKLLRPGGTLATFSCSAAISAQAFHEMLAWAAHDARRRARTLERLGQPPDHPSLVGMPETDYLKGAILLLE